MDEFMYSIMGDASEKYGPASDMEKVAGFLDGMSGEFSLVSGQFNELKESAEERAKRNALLRQRLDGMQGQLQNQVGDLFASMAGLDPSELLSDEEITKHLTDAFNKFDEDNSGELGAWEFQQAWFFLGLKGSEEEIKQAFGDVDTNNSGMIDLDEFCKAIKGNRMMELSLGSNIPELFVSTSPKACLISSSDPLSPKKNHACWNSQAPSSPLLSSSNLLKASVKCLVISSSDNNSLGSNPAMLANKSPT
jgi:hypothetical protein